jgi:TolB-like protein/cytochrome c-type biogenesis protein CcmH/NrfG
VDVAEKAYELDPTVSGTNGLLGALSMYRGEYDEAISHYRKAVELAPSNAIMIGGLAWVLCYSGYPKEAIPLLQQAMRLSPYYPAWMVGTLGLAYMMTGDYPKAIAANEQMIERKSLLQFGYSRLAAIHAVLGNDEKAKVYAADLLNIKPDFNISNWSKVLIYRDQEVLEWELNALRKAGLPENPPLPRPDKPSIAVLPFTNMSADPDQQYFADGISEDLTTDLSKLSGLFVAARNASFAYRSESLDLREVSRELGVRYVLEGSIRRQGEQVRINAQLIDGTTGGHVWAERFDGVMSDIFELQDDVNKKIVDALAVSLTLTEREQLDRVETISSAAYDVLLRGLEQFHLSSPESVREARRLFKRAIEMDPNYARAYANVALTHASEVNFVWYKDKEESIRLGLEYADKAMELDANIPQIYFTRSALYLAQQKYDAAIEAARRTVEVHPNYADGYGMLAFASLWAGNFPEALEAIRKVKQIDSQISYLDLALEARTLFFMKRYDEAVGLIETSVARNSTFDRTQLLLAAIYAQLDRLDDAAWAVEEALVINPEISLDYERRKAYYRRSEDVEHYIEALRKAGVPET